MAALLAQGPAIGPATSESDSLRLPADLDVEMLVALPVEAALQIPDNQLNHQAPDTTAGGPLQIPPAEPMSTRPS